MEKVTPQKRETNKQNSQAAILISGKIEFKTKPVIRDNEGLYNDKEVHPVRAITFINIYPPNI